MVVKIENTHSARAAAKDAGISYGTLRRWLNDKKKRYFTPPSAGKDGSEVLWQGQRRLWRFTAGDLRELKEFVALRREDDGRVRAAAKRERKKKSQSPGVYPKPPNDRLLRRYAAALAELRLCGFRPKDPVLRVGGARSGLGIDAMMQRVVRELRRTGVK
jgi:hypothetical protein